MRKSFLIAVALTTLTMSHAHASLKCAFGKKYEVPPMSESHIHYGSPTKRALNPRSIKVMVWNILKGYKKTWPKDMKRMVQGQDLLLLQEGYLSPVVDNMFENILTDYEFNFATSFLYKKDNHTPTGTVVGAKVPALDFMNLRTTGRESFICTPKTQTVSYYPIHGTYKDLLVVNIHGMNFTNMKKFQNQVLSAVNIIKRHNGPVVYAGDFNTHLKKRKKWLKKTLRSIGMFDVAFRNDRRKKFLVGELDHFFIKGLAIKDAWTEKNKSSDHPAMFAELSLAH